MKSRFESGILTGLLALAMTFSACGGDKTATETAPARTSSSSSPALALAEARNARFDANMNKDSAAVIVIEEGGQFYFGNEKVTRNELQKRVWDKLYGTVSQDRMVYIKSGKSVQYGQVRDLMYSLLQIGYDQIALVVNKDSNSSDPVVLNTLIMEPMFNKVESVSFPPPPGAPAQPQIGSPEPLPPITAPPPGRPTKETIREQVKAIRLLVVDIKPGGSGLNQTVELNRSLMSLDDLATRLRSILDAPESEDKSIIIKAPGDKSYGDVVTVIDVVQGAGAEPIMLAIEDELMPPPPISSEPSGPSAPSRVPGGVPGGVVGGVPGGVPGGVAPPPPPPPIESGKKPEPPKIIRKSGGVLSSDAISKPAPTYPPLAKAARVGGAVVVEVTIDESGNVTSARALSGHPLLKDAAVSAAQRWRFRPTLLSGVPVKVIGTITFNFNL